MLETNDTTSAVRRIQTLEQSAAELRGELDDLHELIADLTDDLQECMAALGQMGITWSPKTKVDD
jgi:phage shock protein A